MNKRFLLLIIIGIILMVVTSTSEIKRGAQSPSKDGSDNQIILFYSEKCPHCLKVEEFIKENKIKLDFERKEAYYNKNNAEELMKKARVCGLVGEINIPFLWDGARCIIGETDIKNFFKQKINEK